MVLIRASTSSSLFVTVAPSLISSLKAPLEGFKELLYLSVNSQTIDVKNYRKESGYFGGTTPIKETEEIISALSQLMKNLDFSKLCGYFGIDFIKKNDGSIYFIEINPRLTTSYIGIRNILNINPVKLILNAKLDLNDSTSFIRENHSDFTRLELKSLNTQPDSNFYDEYLPKLMRALPEIVTPPISLINSLEKKTYQYSCFIATKEKTAEASQKRLNEIMKVFNNNDFESVNDKS